MVMNNNCELSTSVLPGLFQIKSAFFDTTGMPPIKKSHRVVHDALPKRTVKITEIRSSVLRLTRLLKRLYHLHQDAKRSGKSAQAAHVGITDSMLLSMDRSVAASATCRGASHGVHWSGSDQRLQDASLSLSFFFASRYNLPFQAEKRR